MLVIMNRPRELGRTDRKIFIVAVASIVAVHMCLTMQSAGSPGLAPILSSAQPHETRHASTSLH